MEEFVGYKGGLERRWRGCRAGLGDALAYISTKKSGRVAHAVHDRLNPPEEHD